jgi:uncharacterized protein (TIGR00725 family)
MPEKNIGVFGAGNVTESDKEWQDAVMVGNLLARKGYVVMTGGLGGVKTAACMGAKEGGGITLGIMPGTRQSTPANSFVDIAVYTGMGEARNAVNTKSCDAAIAIGGEAGTLSEIALALKGNCPVILLNSWGIVPAGGAAVPGLLQAETAEEAVKLATERVENP